MKIKEIIKKIENDITFLEEKKPVNFKAWIFDKRKYVKLLKENMKNYVKVLKKDLELKCKHYKGDGAGYKISDDEKLFLCRECDMNLLAEMKKQEVIENKLQVVVNTDLGDAVDKLNEQLEKIEDRINCAFEERLKKAEGEKHNFKRDDIKAFRKDIKEGCGQN